MLYREITKDKLKVSQLGYGCMRFPTQKVNGKDGIIEEKAIELIHYAVKAGMNYFDTAFFYHNGNSEALLGKALSGGLREKVYIADKFPMFKAENENSMEEILDGQLKKLQTDYVDFYFLHGIGRSDMETIKKYKLLEKAEELKKKGKIKYFGFSFHDNYDAFVDIVKLYDNWDMCLMQYNYLDQNTQATTKGLELLYEKGISACIMEPLRGGALANIPSEVRKIFDSADKDRSSANWALSWLFDRKEVSVVLSGMSDMEQLKENLEIAGNATAGSFSTEMKEAIQKARTEYDKRIRVKCTDCKYCMPCPKGVDIPFNFSILNSDYKLGFSKSWQYYTADNKSKNASNCIGCKACEPKCPQKIEISKELKQMAVEYRK